MPNIFRDAVGLAGGTMSSITSLFNRIQDLMHGSGVRYIQSSEPFPAASTLPLTNQDRRLLAKTFKLMDDVVKACQNNRLNLKNSPPFILDILPDTYTQLVFVFNNNHLILRGNYYLQVFIQNMQSKCKQVLKLFKSSAIYNEQSAERRELTKFSLIFSHMLFELKAEFPEGIFIGDKFRITKREAEDFWQQNFPKRSCVPWSEFVHGLGKVHKLTSPEKTLELKNTIDLTCNDHVSNFEFDVFTRLFYPWKTLLRNWQVLTTSHPGYVAFLTYDEVKKKLENLKHRPGSYVFRLSCTRPGQWAIGYVAPDGKIYQTIPQNKSLIQAIHEGSKEGFYLYPNGSLTNIDLSTVIEFPQADRVTVTNEQYDLYCEMGTTFELCKICDDNDKNVKIEPCGHLLCGPCLASWQDSDGGNTCPFCRYEIKGTNKVIIERFKPRKNEYAKLKNSTSTAPTPAFTPVLLPTPPPLPTTSVPSQAPPLPPRPVKPPSGRPAAPRPSFPYYVNMSDTSLDSEVPPMNAPPPPRPAAVAPVVATNTNYVNTSNLLD